MMAAIALALAQLREMLAELKRRQDGGVWVFDGANLGGTIDQTILQAQSTLAYLEGEGIERINSPEKFSEGVRGEAAWNSWRDIADQLGIQLSLALGTLSKWSAGETLKRVGYDLKAAAQAVVGATPWVGLFFASLAIIYVVTIGGRR